MKSAAVRKSRLKVRFYGDTAGSNIGWNWRKLLKLWKFFLSDGKGEGFQEFSGQGRLDLQQPQR
ncbi:hypothetical protein QFZ91_007685 [Paraburkholderia sp. JPY419]